MAVLRKIKGGFIVNLIETASFLGVNVLLTDSAVVRDGENDSTVLAYRIGAPVFGNTLYKYDANTDDQSLLDAIYAQAQTEVPLTFSVAACENIEEVLAHLRNRFRELDIEPKVIQKLLEPIRGAIVSQISRLPED